MYICMYVCLGISTKSVFLFIKHWNRGAAFKSRTKLQILASCIYTLNSWKKKIDQGYSKWAKKKKKKRLKMCIHKKDRFLDLANNIQEVQGREREREKQVTEFYI